MKSKIRYHIQSTITDDANPELCTWYHACDNRSAVVREALTMYLAQGDSLQRIGRQLDRIEKMLLQLIEANNE